jgi:hypothetical protein
MDIARYFGAILDLLGIAWLAWFGDLDLVLAILVYLECSRGDKTVPAWDYLDQHRNRPCASCDVAMP